MSSHAAHDTPGPRGIRTVFSHLFAASTVLFLLAGAVIVVCQIVLMVAGDGTGMIAVAEGIGPYAFGAASIAGLLSFALMYVTPAAATGED